MPVAQRAAEIERAIRAHPVVIVCGETGSGKTTQLPKICLAAGRGERGLIGHTQPRRIAARAVATRIAHELGQAVGEAVGYKVRFTDHTRPDAYVKLMTDGILLAETQGDRELAAYDTIIVDEAHERSLNIDFLLGYLKQLLQRRADLKVIITSATLDADRFSRHFGTAEAGAPVIEVSGRTYPVDIRYRPLREGVDVGGTGSEREADDEEELEEAIVGAAEDLWRTGPGDILVFLPGEREIRETGDLLRRGLARRPYARELEILPLFARLSVAEQQRVFAPGSGHRIVLATNVAETSLTVPGIRYVIDAGLARVKRYSVRNKTTLLQIEKVSQAAANQRAGRCGRMQDGICVRLYSEEDFAARPQYTEPEILRSSLASVILRMAALDLPEVAQFPFLEPPGNRAIADGYQLLQELGAVDASRALTPLGRELARLPLDPRIGRIVLAARDGGCLAEALVIASALAVPDPRERPLERQQAADQAHLRFRDDRSDFLSLVALWEFFADATAQKLSHRHLVEACRAQFVSFLRLIEWRDVHRQLVATLEEAGWKWPSALPKAFDAPRYAALHKAVLAGLLGNIGVKAEPDEHYAGTRGLKFYLHPGSGLARKGAKWILAAELTETSRLFARCAAKVEPEWIEEVAGDRVARDYFEPHWEEKRGEVVASERVQLYGLTLVARRPVSFGAIDPKSAREVFIHEALVPGDLRTRGTFLAHNRALIADVAELEHKARRQDVLVDDATIAAFYAERIPEGIHSAVTFERWREEIERREPRRLFLTRDYLMRHAAGAITVDLFPETLAFGRQRAAAQVSVHAGPSARRPDADGAAAVSQPDRGRAPDLARARHDPRKSDALSESVAEAAAQSRDPDSRSRHRVSRNDAGAGHGAARCAARVLAASSRATAARRSLERCRPPAASANERDRHRRCRAGARRRRATLPRCAPSWATPRSCRSRPMDPAFERKGLRQWDFGDLPESLTLHARRPAAHRLSRAGRRGRRRIARAARHQGSGGDRDAGRRRPVAADRVARRTGPLRQGGRGIRAGRAAAQDGDPHGPVAGRRAGRRADAGFPVRRSVAAHRAGVCGTGQARPGPGAGGHGRRLPPAGNDRSRIPGADPAARGRGRSAGAAGGRSPRTARRADLSGVHHGHALGAIATPAPVSEGARPARGQVRRAS